MDNHAIYAVTQDGRLIFVGGRKELSDSGHDDDRAEYCGRIYVSMNAAGEVIGAHVERGDVYEQIQSDDDGESDASVSFGDLGSAERLSDDDIVKIFGSGIKIRDSISYEKERAISVIINYIDNASSSITRKYPKVEVSSWPAKIAAARAYVSGNETADQKEMLSIEASETGIDIESIAEAIINKGALFEKISSYMSGVRRNAIRNIESASSNNAIKAIVDDVKNRIGQKLTEMYK